MELVITDSIALSPCTCLMSCLSPKHASVRSVASPSCSQHAYSLWHPQSWSAGPVECGRVQKTDKSNCCSHETLFHKATCEFKRRDALNDAVISDVGKTPHHGCKPFGSHSHQLIVVIVCFLESHVHASGFWTIFQCCSFVTILLTNFVHASRCSERALDRRLNQAPPNGIHHYMSSSTTGTQLHIFVWRNSGSGPRYLVCASLGFSSPDILETRRAWCCTHKSLTAKCRTLPNPSRWTIPIAAVASDLIATWPHKQKSF